MAWTDDNNKATINQLLDYYADLLSRYADFVKQLGTADLPTKLKSLQTLKSVALTIDALLRRWSFANRGYDSNTHQARQAAAELSNQKSTPEKEAEEVSYTDADRVELKMRLRALPESKDETVFTGEPLEETYSPSPAPSKVKKSTVAAAISNFLEEGEQSTAAIARKTGRSERTVRRDLTAILIRQKTYRERHNFKTYAQFIIPATPTRTVAIQSIICIRSRLQLMLSKCVSISSKVASISPRLVSIGSMAGFPNSSRNI